LLEGSPEEREELLRQRLITLPDAEIAAFDRHFENHISGFYRPDLLEAANRLFGRPLDEETYFNLACGVIGLGCERYHRVLSGTDSLDSITTNQIERMAGSWRLYYVALDRLAEVADVFEDGEPPVGMPPRIQRPKLDGLVRATSVRQRDFPVRSAWDCL
jgi:hypothetical protein